MSAQNTDCGYSLEPPQWGSSNEYPHSSFLSRNKKNNVYPCKPQFYYIKVGFKGVNIIQACFRDVWLCLGLTTRQPLWVILCRLPEKGRKVIEEIVEEIKERDREERNRNKSEETEEIKIFPIYPYLLQG